MRRGRESAHVSADDMQGAGSGGAQRVTQVMAWPIPRGYSILVLSASARTPTNARTVALLGLKSLDKAELVVAQPHLPQPARCWSMRASYLRRGVGRQAGTAHAMVMAHGSSAMSAGRTVHAIAAASVLVEGFRRIRRYRAIAA